MVTKFIKLFFYKVYKVLPVKIRFLISYFVSDKYVIGVIAFVIHKRQLLLLKHTYQYSWGLPGGQLKIGEDFNESIQREIKEETGLVVKVTRILEVKNIVKRPVVDIVVSCEVVEGVTQVDGIEVEEAVFYPLNALPKNILPVHNVYIQKFLKSLL